MFGKMFVRSWWVSVIEMPLFGNLIADERFSFANQFNLFRTAMNKNVPLIVWHTKEVFNRCW